ncbi:uncharacterized protein CEXT_464971 [Caerostris extrusa]|uniref:Uncharacterized protein n=1 Tax=Caerostris extrusa TaxID=172846 RepID=A0AAV4XLN1_CAEEX|nr:uncharacterized protein CEXT_464971 [Caerostris extrusa]
MIDAAKSPQLENIDFYLNKWISSGFAAVLKPNLLFFIWDQLFLNKWENKIFQDICLAFLGLLKPWFMIAKIEMIFIRKKDFIEVSHLNRNIKFNSSDPIPKPPSPKPIIVPKPAVPLPSPPPPPLPKLPDPKPVKPPPKLIPKFIPWVPYNKEKTKEIASVKSKVDLPFDLYVDSVRFVPDNATIIKVTGKVLNMYLGQKEKSIKFQVYPELGSFGDIQNSVSGKLSISKAFQ